MTAVDERNVGSARPRTRAARQPVDRTPYINRELSWLDYSARVLFEARDPRNPLIERERYRSEAADQPFEPIGPGGGEPSGAIEPRFRPTDELFVDPTTQHTMRVHVDPRTGERRYVAEG